MKTNIVIVVAAVVIGAGFLYQPGVSPPVGLSLPVELSVIRSQLETLGVIDAKKTGPIMSELNILWAFGLANKNPILENGPMMDPRYGGAGKFASTGGWTLSVGDAMDHYSMHPLVTLTPDQQALVELVSKNIYRPCCNNSTYFPDCNHGMAMLGLLELMASQGASEEEMYKTALAVNSYWFPENYKVIAQLKLDPKTALSAEYSSGSGYANVVAKLKPTAPSGGASCGV